MPETSKKIFTRICPRCNKPFNTSSFHKRICHECIPYNEETSMYIITCTECGNKFESVKANIKYCPECSKRLNMHQNAPREFTCKICGTKFTRNSTSAKYCDKCLKQSIKNNRDRRKNNGYFSDAHKGFIKPGESIDEIAIAASKAGMTYGKYVQQDYLIKTDNNKITR